MNEKQLEKETLKLCNRIGEICCEYNMPNDKMIIIGMRIADIALLHRKKGMEDSLSIKNLK